MLSRVADALYWMSRYLERAEHTARLLDVHIHAMLDLSHASARSRWERLMAALRISPALNLQPEPYSVTRTVAFEGQNTDSIVQCIGSARENARQVREQISSEMWEQLNQLYLRVSQVQIDDVWSAGPHDFFWDVREGSHLFQGITDSTMNHDQGWQFIQLGRFIERANNTAGLLGVYFSALSHPHGPVTDDYLEWVGLLKCFSAYEAYCKVYTADVRPAKVGEFVMLNPDFPRSIHFAARATSEALEAVAESANVGRNIRPSRLAGRLVAALSYTQVDEILAGGLQTYLDEIQHLCGQIHDAIQQTYIHYAVETALLD